jgi:hypothetical protein
LLIERLALGVEEEVLLAVGQALVDVAAAAGQLRCIPLGHEAGHHAEALADLLGAGLEQDGAVGRFQRAAEGDGGLVDAGAGFGVQAFDGHAEGGHVVHQRVEEAALVGHAQQRIAEHARRDGLGPTPRLAAQLCGVSAKLNHSNSMPAIGAKPSFSGALEHALERLARAHRVGLPSALTNSPRKKGTPPSQGTRRAVSRSMRASASGKPWCQPVTCVLS